MMALRVELGLIEGGRGGGGGGGGGGGKGRGRVSYTSPALHVVLGNIDSTRVATHPLKRVKGLAQSGFTRTSRLFVLHAPSTPPQDRERPCGGLAPQRLPLPVHRPRLNRSLAIFTFTEHQMTPPKSGWRMNLFDGRSLRWNTRRPTYPTELSKAQDTQLSTIASSRSGRTGSPVGLPKRLVQLLGLGTRSSHMLAFD